MPFNLPGHSPRGNSPEKGGRAVKTAGQPRFSALRSQGIAPGGPAENRRAGRRVSRRGRGGPRGKVLHAAEDGEPRAPGGNSAYHPSSPAPRRLKSRNTGTPSSAIAADDGEMEIRPRSDLVRLAGCGKTLEQKICGNNEKSMSAQHAEIIGLQNTVMSAFFPR